MSRVVYSDTPATADQELLRTEHKVRLVAPDEEGNGVNALPDPAAIWDAILDRSTLEYFDTITVKALPSLFDALPGRESEKIEVILVEFEGGGTAELKADQLEKQVRIDYPIDDVILRRAIDTLWEVSERETGVGIDLGTLTA